MNTPTPTPRTDAIASWDEERNRALREGERVVEWRDRAERAEAIVGKLQELHGCSQEMVVHWCEHAANRSLGLDQARSELATERARLDDLVADIKDVCITLESAIADCDDYALQNTEFKIRAVHDVLLQYIPHAAMKEGK